jgi:hypothetical protein
MNPQKPSTVALLRQPMRILARFVLLACVSCHSTPPSPRLQPWREVTMPTVAEAAAAFPQPPMEYRAIHWAFWGGQQSKERILADLERIHTNGGGVYMINNSRGLRPKYFTPEYLDLVKFTVEECKKRGMKVWIEGDAGYPDGFAGGMISRDYPQLGMQGIVADARLTVAGGQTLNMPLPPDTLGIVANQRAGAAAPGAEAPAPTGTALPLPADGKFKWTARGASEVTIQGPGGDVRYSVVAGQTLTIPLASGTRGIMVNSGGGGRGRGGRAVGGAAQPGTVLPLPADGQLRWTAPGTGTWELTFVRHVYRSSPTRFVNREDETNDKDSLYSLIDYLDPEATRTYLKVIYQTYEKLVGEEFGKTILGFRGDETDFTGFMPWTPKLLETFQKEKGYDLKPWIVQFFAGGLTAEAQRAKADYWDVWSGLFRDHFYKLMEEWCKARQMEFMVHLNHEELMMGGGGDMIRNEGSFFRDMRYVGVPGVDNLNQIGPGIVADFPKLAASAAHVTGRPLVWDEEGGGTGQNGKFVVNYQLVRGINYMNIRGLSSAGGAEIGWYVSRAQHLLAMGRPAAQVALFHPTDSMWMNDKEADDVTLRLVTQLLEHQIDFDHIDSDELASLVTREGGGLKNLSGQIYRAVIVPTSTVIQKAVLERLRAFAAAGGKVVFVGRTPAMVVDRTFLHPKAGAPDLSFATLEPMPEITDRVVAALPPPDVKLDTPCPPVKYLHRALKDGEVYFFFNESNQIQPRTATLASSGHAEVWDAASGTIHPLDIVAKEPGHVTVTLPLGPQEARFIVLRR